MGKAIKDIRAFDDAMAIMNEPCDDITEAVPLIGNYFQGMDERMSDIETKLDPRQGCSKRGQMKTPEERPADGGADEDEDMAYRSGARRGGSR